METQIHGNLTIDLEGIDEKVKAVIDAKEALDKAVLALEWATQANCIKLTIKGTPTHNEQA